MRLLTQFGAAALLLCASTFSYAAILTVSTTHDEANARTSNVGTDKYPLSTGCSLREAMQDIVIAANSAPGATQPFPECGTASKGTGNTIMLAGNAVQVNATEKDPSDITGKADINYGTLPNIGDAAIYGGITITGGAVSCFSDPSAMPPMDGVIMFKFVGSSSATFSGVSFSNCTAAANGVAITNDSGDLNLTGVTFTNIHATNQGSGACISHGSGNLSITGGSFTACVVDDGGLIPGGGHGQGGALFIGGVGGSTKALIGGVTFQGNIAGDSGGAIYLSGTDAIAISMSAFQANVADGNTGTMTGQNAELGGGAIYASNVATGGHDDSDPLVNASAFLILNSSFIGNLAPQGTGGAILSSHGNIAWGKLSVGDLSGPVLKVPGGIIASNFSGNIASGTWATVPVDARAGSGGAIFANAGDISILDSSFVVSNTSSNASGGAIAYIDLSNDHTLSVSNTTFNGNSAQLRGGAIANLNDFASATGNGKITLTNDTIAGNSTSTAGGGGAFYNANPFAPDVIVRNTIFSSNTGENCNTGIAFTDGSGNLQFPATSNCGSIANKNDPMLATAAPFGGINALVFVMKLNDGSAASDAGTESNCSDSPIFDLDAALNSRPKGGPNCDVGAFEAANAPDLSITKTHTDPFTQGDMGDTYTIAVSNVGNSMTDGAVTVTDTLPAGLTALTIVGPGWTCAALPTLSCTRNDALPAGSAYPNIVVTVSVSTTAAAMVTNTANVSGGSDSSAGNNVANDLTHITAVAPDLTITKTHADPFAQGDTGDAYTLTVTNAGNGATTGTVTVADALPAGMSATQIIGTGWTCAALPTLNCTRSDALAPTVSYPVITVTVNVAANASTPETNTATVSGGGETNAANDTANDITNITAVVLTSDLTITKTHTDPFMLGSTGNPYAITVSNAGNGPTSGTVTVIDTLPSGLTATAIAGTGWTCSVPPTLSCTRTDALAKTASYPPITVTVSAANNAASPETNTAAVSGGGETNTTNDTANDITNITGIPDLTVSKSHAGNFTPGQVGAIYTITPRNNGTAATTGLVTMTDALPLGLTATSIAGTGWTCSPTPLVGPGNLGCTRSDAMAAKTDYPAITLTVNVAANAPNPLVNAATMSGGGETDTTNDTATDQTTTPVRLQSFGVD